MKTKQMLLAGILMFAAATSAQAQTSVHTFKKFSPEERVRIDRNFGRALGMTNEGVVESALSLVTMMKLDLPGEEFPLIMKEVRQLAATSKTPKLRYMACLAEAVFYHPERFKDAPVREYNDNDAFFTALDDSTDAQTSDSH